MRKTLFRHAAAALFAALVLCFAAPVALSQTAAPGAKDATPKGDEKAEAVLRRALEVLGGQAFLGVRTVVSRGNFTQFQAGQTSLPVAFVDYLVFPDRERTEFRGSAVRSIQTNTGETGWIYDAMTRKLRDIKPEQAKEFRTNLRVSLDNVLRGWWRAEGAALAYVGRREAGLGSRNETVRLTYPDGFAVEFEFGARDGLPAKVRYKKPGEDGVEVEEEDRYAQFLTVGGVTAPFVVDHYRAGQQTSRVNYEKVEFNLPVPDSLFARPADAKALK